MKEEENLRQCEQLISELQSELPGDDMGCRGYMTQRVSGSAHSSSRRMNPVSNSAAFASNSLMMKTCGSLNSLRVNNLIDITHSYYSGLLIVKLQISLSKLHKTAETIITTYWKRALTPFLNPTSEMPNSWVFNRSIKKVWYIDAIISNITIDRN